MRNSRVLCCLFIPILNWRLLVMFTWNYILYSFEALARMYRRWMCLSYDVYVRVCYDVCVCVYVVASMWVDEKNIRPPAMALRIRTQRVGRFITLGALCTIQPLVCLAVLVVFRSYISSVWDRKQRQLGPVIDPHARRYTSSTRSRSGVMFVVVPLVSLPLFHPFSLSLSQSQHTHRNPHAIPLLLRIICFFFEKKNRLPFNVVNDAGDVANDNHNHVIQCLVASSSSIQTSNIWIDVSV